MTPIDFLDHGAANAPDRDCLVDGDQRLTYREVQRWTHRIAWALSRDGLQPGDRVAVLSPNSAAGYLVMLGLLRAGAVWIPMNARGTAKDWSAQAERTGTTWVFVHDEFADAGPWASTLRVVGFDSALVDSELTRWCADVADDGFATPWPPGNAGVFRITSSGGTTGAPKSIVQTQAGLAANVAAFRAIASHAEPRFLMCNPMTHAAGVFGFPILSMGGCIVFMRRPDPKTLPAVIAHERITATIVAPTTLYALMEEGALGDHDLSSLRFLFFGTAPMPPELLQRALKVFGPALAQGYAQSEASTLITAMLPADYAQIAADPALAARLRSVGRETPFARVAIMDDAGRLLPPREIGEVVIRSPMVMAGYLNDPEGSAATRAHGWHHTTDLGYLDEAGYLYIVDRKRDVIITGGFNVFPSEVEEVIGAWPGVRACAVIGVKDERWGEAVKAAVEADRDIDIDALAAHCKQVLGSVKCPKSFDLWPELPRSALGKILKRNLRDHYDGASPSSTKG